jgi:hypothetical protein
MNSLKNITVLVLTTALIYFIPGCNSQQKPDTQNETQSTKEPVFKVTFIELGLPVAFPARRCSR